MEQLEVGKKVFLKPVGNRARWGNNEIVEKNILKIGKKYFYVGLEGEKVDKHTFKFHINGLKHENNGYSANWQLYFDQQQILDEKESYALVKEVRLKFDIYSKVDLTLDQLRRIVAIINEK